MIRLLLLTLALLLAGCDTQPQFGNTDISAAGYATDFALTDHNGKPRTMADFRGKAVVIFFGYTQCPDVCPTTMTGMAEAMKLLGEDASKVQVLFVTVDPERDTPQLLAQYVPVFNPSFLGLYADAQTIARTAQEFRIFYKKQPGSTPTTYTVDHTAGSYVYDPQGRLRLYVKHGEKPEVIAKDLRLLIAGK
ncbi:MAG: SCO family protein [Rhodocyclaceae bacterium]|jgi:protein SCO1/2|nr:SCO family protein [Rhodocyclaceae bacterium]MCW5597095.1 SCO family protein [Rhodocyclaceae bacterium]PKO72877.1 MAG: cytochrome c oxidase assembly protein [Betaproteobacteria bacterium HGW-Betaproteobacteria-14]PKO94912.1 MAG: cytochrome c oxidase assembly protein [Betaproteobacteria bacterium HGW-Betaproteobacteria-10]